MVVGEGSPVGSRLWKVGICHKGLEEDSAQRGRLADGSKDHLVEGSKGL